MLYKGSVVCSLSGHDKGRMYLVVKLDGDFAYVVDGKFRLKDNPKKKRIQIGYIYILQGIGLRNGPIFNLR